MTTTNAIAAAVGIIAVLDSPVSAQHHTLEPAGFIALPAHSGSGGFDHAEVDTDKGRLYIAHTANDALDVVDVTRARLIASLPGLKAVAGVLVSGKPEYVFTSNRGANTVTILTSAGADTERTATLAVADRPNGLAFDPKRGLLLVAHTGTPPRLLVIDAAKRSIIGRQDAPGRTRWAMFDPAQGLFFVNIADPAMIVAIDPKQPNAIARRYPVPAQGPHGLAVDSATGQLFTACDSKQLIRIDAKTGAIRGEAKLSGAPDAIFLDERLRRLYVAIGSPGVIDVIDVDTLAVLESVPTEAGAHTMALDAKRGRVYALLPQSHRAAVFKVLESAKP